MFDGQPIRKMLDEASANEVFPCAAVSVGDGGGEIFRYHCGFRALFPKKEPLDENTMFDLASLTKIMSTALVVLKLAEAGKLALDDRLGQFFDVPRDKSNITIQNLLTHTSGLPAHVRLDELTDNPQEVCRFILNLAPNAQAGVNVEYSCLGFFLLRAICETVSGKGLCELAGELLFDPLGISAVYNPPVQYANFAATEYCDKRGEWLCGIVHDENARFVGGISGNAGLFGTLRDCAVFARASANREILSKDMFIEATRNHTPHCDEGRGLGFAVKGRMPVSCGNVFGEGSFGHTGFTGTSIWVDAETSQYVVLLTNRVHFGRENKKLLKFRGAFHDLCAATYRKTRME